MRASNAREATVAPPARRGAWIGVLAVLPLLLTACSGPQAYGVGQAWQRNECYRIQDAQDRSRCLSSAGQSYEDYQREAEAAKSANAPWQR